MQAYKYKGYASDGSLQEGNILAGSVEEAERRIVAQDITLVLLTNAGSRKAQAQEIPVSGPRQKLRGKGLSISDAAAILENLALMSETGVPLVEALDAAAVGAKNPRVAYLLDTVKSEIISGKSLSTALRTADGLFPPLVSDMVRVAEEGGRLDHALRTAASYLERQAELRKKLINASMYPLVMLTISAVTVLVLVVFVMPRFATIFTQMGVAVPESTQIMLSVGNAIRSHPIFCILGAVGFVLAVRFVFRSKAVSEAGSKLLLKLPVLGDLLKKLALSRAFGSLATLLSGNVPIMAAMEHSAKVAGVAEIRNAIMRARTAVEHGRTMADAFAETKAIPPALLQMVTIGEKTGRLAPVLEATANKMEADVDARMKAMVSIVEPVMIVVMGLVVGSITVSIIGPIYSVVQNIK